VKVGLHKKRSDASESQAREQRGTMDLGKREKVEALTVTVRKRPTESVIM